MKGSYDGDQRREDLLSRPNDPRWYTQNPQQAKDVASFPYAYRLGNKLNLGQYAVDVNANAIPGVMAIHTAPAFGYSNIENSPINIAARNIYSYVRHANSGHTNYDSPDLMLYLMAMDNCYSYISYLKRVYGVAMTYSTTNAYYPKAMINAMGVDFEDLQAHLADFRASINMLATRVGSMCVPASMSYFARHMWMYQGYYLDDNQDKAQTYMFVPDGFFTFGFDEDGAGQLTYAPLIPRPYGALTPTTVEAASLLTTKQLINYAYTLIDPIIREEDFGIMSGDILKAFGREGLFKLEGITETYTVLPSYDQEVLQQIENLTLIGTYYQDEAILHQNKSADPTATENNAWLQFTPKFAHPYAFTRTDVVHPGYNVYLSDNFVNFHHGDIGPDDTMEATRLSNIADSVNYDENSLNYSTYGSDVAMYAYIYYYSERDEGWVLTRSRTLYQGNTAVVDFMTETSMVGVTISGNVNGYGGSTFMEYNDDEGVWQLPIQSVNVNNAQVEIMNAFLLAQQLSNFDWHPALALTIGIMGSSAGTRLDGGVKLLLSEGSYADQHTASYKAAGVDPAVDTWFETVPVYGRYNGNLFDLAYYTIVTADNLRLMSEVALLSEFNVEQFGKVTT